MKDRNNNLGNCIRDISDKLSKIEVKENYMDIFSISSTLNIHFEINFKGDNISEIIITLSKFNIPYIRFNSLNNVNLGDSISYYSDFYDISSINQDSILELFITKLYELTDMIVYNRSYMYVREQKINKLLNGD